MFDSTIEYFFERHSALKVIVYWIVLKWPYLVNFFEKKNILDLSYSMFLSWFWDKRNEESISKLITWQTHFVKVNQVQL